MWNATTGALIHTYNTPLEFSSDGNRLLSWEHSLPHLMTLWDVATGMQLRTFTVSAASASDQVSNLEEDLSSRLPDIVTTAKFSLDNAHLLSGSNDGSINLWDVATGKLLQNS